MCKYKGCNREEYKNTGYCIFHCDKRNFTKEEIEEFKKEFQEEFKKQEESKAEKFNFVGFIFPDNFSFKKIEFKKAVNFKGATFGNKVNFWGAKFGNKVNFWGATFGDEANFWGATFGSEAWFVDAKFGDRAKFKGATFGNMVYFMGATFGNEAWFLDAKFGNRAAFAGATFGSEVYFRSATFGSEVWFVGVKFGNEANFMGATFGNMANFMGATFFGSVKFIGEGENKVFNSVKFSYSNFEHPENVEFVDVNLSRAEFLHCKNIDKIGRFEKIIWSEKDGRKAVYDEVKLEEDRGEKKGEKPYEYIAEVYRKLRLNYERNLRFSEAGDLYIGEMEMKRKNAEVNKKYIDYMMLTFYKYASDYGENYLRPLGWMIVVISAFALIHFDLQKSILIFVQMPPANVEMNLIVASQRILGILFLALFVLALRRKFKKS